MQQREVPSDFKSSLSLKDAAFNNDLHSVKVASLMRAAVLEARSPIRIDQDRVSWLIDWLVIEGLDSEGVNRSNLTNHSLILCDFTLETAPPAVSKVCKATM